MSPNAASAYRVLARKYRPERLSDLVGQDALVRTLTNAFALDRIAQAFILTGIRGVGKTTAARIIAKGLNCTGPDGQGKPTPNPCGVCDHCRAIMAGRHVDVLEMDAASHTGVNDVREIIDSLQYSATSGRFKVYIIDEVHMLSNSAFNALLKSLEEPPSHVKFIFATTEVGKVPVTVLSRCQRFDLRRITSDLMMTLLRRVADQEGASITDGALALITRASEGSARDATSLLDQAINLNTDGADEKSVRALLGMADRKRVLDLFELIMKGEAKAALQEFDAQYSDGVEPIAIFSGLAEVAHWLSVVQIADHESLEPFEHGARALAHNMAQKLKLPVLARAWQMLVKLLQEISQAPNARMAAEMGIIRLAYVASLPNPEEIVRQLSRGGGDDQQPPSSVDASSESHRDHGPTAAVPADSPTAMEPLPPTLNDARDTGNSMPSLGSFDDVIDLLRRHREMSLLMEVEHDMGVTSFAHGHIEYAPAVGAAHDLGRRLGGFLRQHSGSAWKVIPTAAGKGQTIAATRKAELEADPIAAAVRHHFPDAGITPVEEGSGGIETVR